MQFLTFFALAATTVLALPSDNVDARNYPACTPPQYQCKSDVSGWLVCNVDGTWLDGGVCPKGTTCKPINNLPYCT